MLYETDRMLPFFYFAARLLPLDSKKMQVMQRDRREGREFLRLDGCRCNRANNSRQASHTAHSFFNRILVQE